MKVVLKTSFALQVEEVASSDATCPASEDAGLLAGVGSYGVNKL
jgi:hypothetical protein